MTPELPLSAAEEVEARLWTALRDVEDPEIPVSVVGLGLIVTIAYNEVEHAVDLQLTFTAMGCPAMEFIEEDIRDRLLLEPDVDIVRIEPEPNDELMFQTSIMNFTSRVEIARHGFESVTLKLSEDYGKLREVCERHGIQISATRVRKVVKHFAAEKERTRAWRKILEQTTGTLLRQSAGD